MLCPSFQIEVINGQYRTWRYDDFARIYDEYFESGETDYSTLPEARGANNLAPLYFYADNALISENLYGSYWARRYLSKLNNAK